MSKKLKLSQWHDRDAKPARAGWYQVKGEFSAGKHGKGKDFSAWRRWTGYSWRWVDYSGKEQQAAFWENDQWRGIVK